VLGTGQALPGEPLPTSALLRRLDERFGVDFGRRGRSIAQRLGIATRFICRDFNERDEAPRRGDSNAELAARAVRAALADAGCSLQQVRYLIAHTATPGRSLPPGVAAVADELHYDGPFAEFRQACTGFANALIMAQGVLGGLDADAAVVIVGSETGSVYFDPLRAAEQPGQLINLLQMGDAAAAIVLSRGHGQPDRAAGPRAAVGTIMGSFCGQAGHGSGSAFQLRAGGSEHVAAAARAAEFEHDFTRIRSDGARLFEAGFSAGAALGADLGRVDCIIPHQANGRMAALLSSRFGCNQSRVFVNAQRVANTGSAAIWLALDEARRQLPAAARVLALGAEATRFMYGGFVYRHGGSVGDAAI
jgi:3-oxoacyl-[acyl-carrier-protein] synthase III